MPTDQRQATVACHLLTFLHGKTKHNPRQSAVQTCSSRRDDPSRQAESRRVKLPRRVTVGESSLSQHGHFSSFIRPRISSQRLRKLIDAHGCPRKSCRIRLYSTHRGEVVHHRGPGRSSVWGRPCHELLAARHTR